MGKNHYDEYDDIYSDEFTGYRFTYGNHILSDPKKIRQDEIESIDEPKQGWGHTPVFVFCRTCNIYMDYNPANMDFISGNWKCPQCGKYVRELTVRTRLSSIGCEATEQIFGLDKTWSESYTYDDGDDRYDWSDL